MRPRELYETAVAHTTEHYFWGNELDPAYKRHIERVHQLQDRTGQLFTTAGKMGVVIEEVVIPFPTGTRAGWLETAVTKRMLQVDFPADAAIQSLVQTPDARFKNGEDLEVIQSMVLGVHDIQQREGIPWNVHDVHTAKSLDIITSFFVVDRGSGTVLEYHPLDDVRVLERLDVNYPVFPSRDASFRVGNDEHQLDPGIEVTQGMELAARARWNQGWGQAIEGMHGALDQIDRALTNGAWQSEYTPVENRTN